MQLQEKTNASIITIPTISRVIKKKQKAMIVVGKK